MGLFSFVSGLFGGGAQKKASRKAMEAQVAAYNRGIDLQQQQYDTTRSDYMPYTTAGGNAVTALDDLMRAAMGGGYGTPPTRATPEMVEAQEALEAKLTSSPLYQTLYRGGEEAVLQNASATGGLRGGNTSRGLADFGSDVLARVYDDQFQKLGALAGLGIGATGSVASAGLANANAATQLYGQIGDARANNYLTRGGINAANFRNIGSFADSIASSFMPGGGGAQSAFKSLF